MNPQNNPNEYPPIIEIDDSWIGITLQKFLDQVIDIVVEGLIEIHDFLNFNLEEAYRKIYNQQHEKYLVEHYLKQFDEKIIMKKIDEHYRRFNYRDQNFCKMKSDVLWDEFKKKVFNIL